MPQGLHIFHFLHVGVVLEATRKVYMVMRSYVIIFFHRRPRILTRDVFAVGNLVILTSLWADADRPKY